MRTPGDQEPTQVLKNHAARISVAANFIVNTTKDWQIIKQYLTQRIQEINLTPYQQAKLERYQYMYNQLVSGKYTDQEVLTSTMKLYDLKERQVYEDLNCTRELFNCVININKRFELSAQLQINRNMLRKAEELCDFRAYAALEKNRALMLNQIEDIAENDGDIFQGHEINAVFDPSLIGAEEINMDEVLKEINAKRKAKIKTSLFTDIPYEPVNEKTNPL